MDANGNLAPLRAGAAEYEGPRFSPDGRRLAVAIHQGGQWDLWVREWERDTLSRLTFGDDEDRGLTWAPYGQSIAFASSHGNEGIMNLYWRRADGTGEPERLTEPEAQNRNGSFFRSGEQIWVATYVAAGDSFRVENVRLWSPTRVPGYGGDGWFDLHPDGKRFAVLMAAEETQARRDKVVFITNFFDERRIAPVPKR